MVVVGEIPDTYVQQVIVVANSEKAPKSITENIDRITVAIAEHLLHIAGQDVNPLLDLAQDQDLVLRQDPVLLHH
jgi:hypothetical protein